MVSGSRVRRSVWPAALFAIRANQASREARKASAWAVADLIRLTCSDGSEERSKSCSSKLGAPGANSRAGAKKSGAGSRACSTTRTGPSPKPLSRVSSVTRISKPAPMSPTWPSSPWPSTLSTISSTSSSRSPSARSLNLSAATLPSASTSPSTFTQSPSARASTAGAPLASTRCSASMVRPSRLKAFSSKETDSMAALISRSSSPGSLRVSLVASRLPSPRRNPRALTRIPGARERPTSAFGSRAAEPLGRFAR